MRRQRLLAGSALVALVVGIPAVLMLTSGPPPTGLPGLHQVERALRRPLSDGAVLRVVAVAGWALWILFALAVVTELVAAVRHRPSPGQAGNGWRVPGLQGLAAALVVSALLAGGSRHDQPSPSPTRPTGPSPALLAGHTAQEEAAVGPAVSQAAGTRPPTAQAVSTGAPPGYRPYAVVPYDSPWAIAEAHLGNGLRWTQILDDQGRSLVDGQTVVAASWGSAVEDTARTIYPGQVLYLPPDATGVALPPPSPPSPSPPSQPATTPPVGPSAPPATVWTGTLPAEATALRHRPSIEEVPVELAAARTLLPGPVEPGPGLPMRDLVLGGALVASAGLNVLALRRARQAGGAARGERAPVPSAATPVATAAEIRVRARTDARPAEVTRRVLAAVEADAHAAGRPLPLITGLVAAGAEVEVFLDQPAEPPAPWRGDLSRRRWHRPLTTLPDLDGRPSRHPGIVPVGLRRGDSAHVLLNLEAAPITALVGDEDVATALLQGVSLAFAGLTWTTEAEVILVGFGDVLARCRPHVRSVDRIRSVATELRATACPTPGSPPPEAEPGTARRRRPTFVVARHLDAGEARVLREVCRADTAIRALVAGDPGTADWLAIDADGLHLPWLDEPVIPAAPGAADLAGFEDLLRLALTTPLPDPARAPAPLKPRPDLSPVAAPAVLVQVLGPIEVAGLASDFRRPQAREVLVFLAMRRSGAAEHEVDAALWPERPTVKASTRDPVISAARSAVGGTARLPYADGQGPDKRYRVTTQVSTDWDRFRSLHHQGRADGSPDALVAALRLIRGRPFADVLAGPGYGWLHLEGHLHAIEAEIVDAADLAADLLLAEGDGRQARWAAAQGLAASPYSERLWTQLMAAADALGEAQEVERILAEMDRRLDLRGDFSQLHPDTLAAYRRYSRRTRGL